VGYDTPHDGKSLSFDAGDERTEGYDNTTVVNANPRDSGTLTKIRGERHGGAARRLTKRKADGETGAKRRGSQGPEVIPSGGNKGGQMEKHARGREEERGEPGVAAPVQAGHLDQTTRG
jgi:hypothetical protein